MRLTRCMLRPRVARFFCRAMSDSNFPQVCQWPSRHIDLLRRASDQEVEFATIMWFDDLAAVRRFMGDDYDVSHVPLIARAVLARFDERSTHYDVVDRRSQGG